MAVQELRKDSQLDDKHIPQKYLCTVLMLVSGVFLYLPLLSVWLQSKGNTAFYVTFS